MGQVVKKWRTPMYQDVKRDRVIVRRAILPTPTEATEPLKRQGPDGGLMCGALVALLRVVGAGPEGMPKGFSGPFHARLSQACGALPAPMDPGFIAAAFRHWRAASTWLERIGGGRALTRFADVGDVRRVARAPASRRSRG